MAEKSRIEWTEATWNPVTGCSKVSPGCAHCYAETLSLRFGWSRKPWAPEHEVENVVLHPERLKVPLRWRRPRLVFVNSMSDLFHELVPYSFVDEIFEVMAEADHHVFQVLTKRPEIALRWWRSRGAGRLPPNVWLGVSIENSRFTFRADALRALPAAVRFVSAEPLLGSLFEPSSERSWNDARRPLDLAGIDWLIVGGESGPHFRPMHLDWARELRDACARAGVAFFFKQWGGRTPKAGGRELDDRTWDDFPQGRRVLGGRLLDEVEGIS